MRRDDRADSRAAAARRRLALLGAAATVVPFLSGCGSQPRGLPAGGTTPPPTVGPVQTVRIGFIGHTTGTGAATAVAVERGERLAVQQFGGGTGITLLVEDADSDGTAAGAAAAARRLVADRVVAVIGLQTAAEVSGAVPVLARAGIPTLTAAGGATAVGPATPASTVPGSTAPPTLSTAASPTAPTTGPATAPTTGPATSTTTAPAAAGPPALLRVAADDAQQGAAAADELTGALGALTLAVLDGGAAADRATAGALVTQAEATGATVTERDTVTDRRAVDGVARRIVGAGAAGTYFSGSVATAAEVISALGADGYQGAVVVSAGTRSPQAVGRALGEGADGTYVLSPADDPAAAAAGGGAPLVFDDAYRAAFGRMPPAWAAEAYDATRFVVAALATGVTTAGQLGAYLMSHTWAGVTGSLSFAADGSLVAAPVFVSQMRAGALVQIGTVGQPRS